ncbi:MAG: SDR family oxidoreductase [Chloroflexota bacterium]
MIQELFSLSGKRALVTGGNSGIGKGMAMALSHAGADVVIVGRNAEKVKTAVAEISENSNSCRGISFNLIEEPLQNLTSQLSDIDILVNAAGINLRQPVDNILEKDWDQTLHINLKTPFFLAQLLVKKMIQKGWGRIINVASLQSQRAFKNGLAYGASKGGVVQLTRAMAEAWSDKGINTNAIAPGFFPTPLTQPLFDNPKAVQKLAAQTAIGRNGTMDDLLGITIFLASVASNYVTGQVIYLDGGYTAK